jgi:hypothetical protein
MSDLDFKKITKTLRPFFGFPDDDDRFCLFIAALETSWKKSDLGSQDKNIVFQYNEEYYEGADPGAKLANKDKEWSDFFGCLTKYTNEINVNEDKREIVKAIIVRYKNHTSNSNDTFIRDVITRYTKPDIFTMGPITGKIPYNIRETVTGTCDKSTKHFSFIYSKYLLRKSLEDGKNSAVPSDPFWKKEVAGTQSEYFRMEGNPEQIYKRDAEGNAIPVGKGSEAMRAAETDKCMGTKINDTDPTSKECKVVLEKCIEGTDIDMCKAFMQDPNYFKIAEGEIQKMLPDIALMVLRKVFKFNRTTNPETNLVEAETFGEWLLRQKTLVDEPTFKNIQDNGKLKTYIEGLVSKVNSNPTILNPSYLGDGKTVNKTNYNSIFNGWLSTKYGIPGRIMFKNKRNNLNVTRQIDLVSNNLLFTRNSMQSKVMLLPGGKILVNGSTFPFVSVLTGGSNDDNEYNQDGGAIGYFRSVADNEMFKPNGPLLKELTANMKATADAYGIRFDFKTLNEKIDSLIKSEKGLFQAAAATLAFFSDAERYGKYDKSQVLTVDTAIELAKARDERLNRVDNKTNDLIVALQKLADSFNNALTEETKKSVTPSTGTL